MNNEAKGITVTGTVHYQGKYLLVRRTRADNEDPLAGFWAFPGGRVQFYESSNGKFACETLTQALARELAEEVGLEFDSAFYVDSYSSLGKRAAAHFCVNALSDKIQLNDELEDFCWISSSDEMAKFSPIIPGLINHMAYIEQTLRAVRDPFIPIEVLDLMPDRYINK
jgi:NUDIX domain